MKDIITSNGQFNITSALFESIKKNNPELLEYMEKEGKGKINISLYKKIYKDITGKETSNNEDWDKNFISYILKGCDVDTFRRIIKLQNKKNDEVDPETSIDLIMDKNDNKTDIENQNEIRNYMEKVSKAIKSVYGDNVSEEIIDKIIDEYSKDLYNDNGIIKGLENSYKKIHDDLISLSKMKKEISKKYKENNSDNINESVLLEDDESDDIKKLLNAFANGGLKQAKKEYNEIMNIEDVDYNNSFDPDFKMVDDSEFFKRLQDYQSNYLTTETSEFLAELYNNYKKTIEKKENYQDKPDVYNKLDAINSIYEFMKNSYGKTDMSDDDYIIQLRLKILGFDKNDEIYEEIRKKLKTISDIEYKNKFNIDFYLNVEHNILENVKDKLNNEKNLLKYLTESEWKSFANTMIRPSKQGTEEEFKVNVEHSKEVFKIFLFDTKIPTDVTNFYKRIQNDAKEKLIPMTYKFYDFGSGKMNRYYYEQIKSSFFEYFKGNKEVYNNIPAHKIVQTIGPEYFWKNVAYVDCRTREAYNNITAIISNVGKTGFNVNRVFLPNANLNTNTIIYAIISGQDEDCENLEIRGSNQKFKDYKIIKDNKVEFQVTPADIRDVSKTKRIYFIMISEGLIRKGKLVSDILSKIKNAGKVDTSMSATKKFFGY